MIGEMRDKITAKAAIAASLTGHLVFSTLHTNNAPETIIRLIEMGEDPINFADAMLGIIAQRLVRRLCNQCKVPYHPSREEYGQLVAAYGEDCFVGHGMPAYGDDLTLMRSGGCPACDGFGYSGRIAIQELLVNSPGIKLAIRQRSGADDIERVAREEGMVSLRQDGIEKVFQGITDLNQVHLVCI
jgi:type II secretory ATPase GspE/PulE/Tfp pilus assembly ATPase PilB-like protein